MGSEAHALRGGGGATGNSGVAGAGACSTVCAHVFSFGVDLTIFLFIARIPIGPLLGPFFEPIFWNYFWTYFWSFFLP